MQEFEKRINENDEEFKKSKLDLESCDLSDQLVNIKMF
jgi:hypothetical protein